MTTSDERDERPQYPPPEATQEAQLLLAAFLMDALEAGPLELELEPHKIGDRELPSFTAHVGDHELIVHVDGAIA